MKILLHITAVILLLESSFVWAKHEGHSHDYEALPETKQVDGIKGTACENVIDIAVNGLVCDFCARALEKVIGKRDDVLGIDVDLDNSKVIVAMKEGKTIDDETLTELINDSGYNVVTIDKGC